MTRLLAALVGWACLFLSGAAAWGADRPKGDLASTTSTEEVEIRLGYHGEEILIYGSLPDRAEVAIKVLSPPEVLTIRRKGRWGPFWTFVESVRVEGVPGLFKVYTSGPLDEIPAAIRARYGIDHSFSAVRRQARFRSPDSLIFGGYLDEMIALKEGRGLFEVREGSVEKIKGRLFRTTFHLPAVAPTGTYRVEVYAVRDDRVIGVDRGEIRVEKVGLQRWLTRLAGEHSGLYGALGVVLAVVWGVGSVILFKEKGVHG